MVLTGDTTALQVAEIPCLVLGKGVSGRWTVGDGIFVYQLTRVLKQ